MQRTITWQNGDVDVIEAETVEELDQIELDIANKRIANGYPAEKGVSQ